MSNLTTSEPYLDAREAELAALEQRLKKWDEDLTDREEEFGERAVDFNPTVRAILTLAAQGLGFFLLFVLGTGTFEVPAQPDKVHPDLVRGLHFIVNVSWFYLILSLLICFALLCYAYVKKGLDSHVPVDVMLLTYVGMDILLLLLLVYQQGGLCRSMFLPVFFLIPTAYLIVERREKIFRWRRLFVLAVIMGCICSAYRVSVILPPPPPSNSNLSVVNGTVLFLHHWPLQVTDFSALAHADYDKAIFRASLISAFVPIIQILIVMFRARVRKRKDDASSKVQAAEIRSPEAAAVNLVADPPRSTDDSSRHD